MATTASANVEGRNHHSGCVVGLTHHPEFLTIGRFDISRNTSSQSTAIKSVVRSTLAAERRLCLRWSSQLHGFDISWQLYMARSFWVNVEKGSLKGLRFTDICSLGKQSRKMLDKAYQCITFAHVFADFFEGHSRCVFRLSYAPVRVPANLRQQKHCGSLLSVVSSRNEGLNCCPRNLTHIHFFLFGSQQVIF